MNKFWFRHLYVFLPRQCGISLLHKPWEVHSVPAVTFRTKPLSQVTLHWEPKLKSSWGSEQDNEPWGGEFRVVHLLAEKGTQKGREQINNSSFNVVKRYQKEITTTDYNTDINFYPSNMVYLHSTFPASCTQCWHSHSAESPHHRWSHTENQNWRNHVGQNKTGSHEEDLLDYTSSL